MEDQKNVRDIAAKKVANVLHKKKQLDDRVAKVEQGRKQILQGLEGPEKIINKLKVRQISYKKWINKLAVTKIFVNERRNYYERSFRKITAVTGITNPNDIEGLLGFIERNNDLKKTKVVREKKVEQLKLEKADLEDEYKEYLDGQPQYEQTHVDEISSKISQKEKRLKDLIALKNKH